MNNHMRFLPQTESILKDEKGVVIITALMILVLLTIIGVASTTVSNTETKIATNEAVYQQSLYQAEGATIEAVERMDEPGFDPKGSHPWMWATLGTFTENDLYEVEFWDGLGSEADSDLKDDLKDTKLFVVPGGIVEGESLDMGSTKIHRYAVYGRCAPTSKGATTVEIGYLKAF